MPYRVRFSDEAERDLRALSGFVRAQVLDVLDELAQNPRPTRAKELRDKRNIFRVWVAGKWRIVYEIDQEERTVVVMRIRPKSQIDYDNI